MRESPGKMPLMTGATTVVLMAAGVPEEAVEALLSPAVLVAVTAQL